MVIKSFCQDNKMTYSQALELPLLDLEMWAVFNSIDLDARNKGNVGSNKVGFTQDNYKNFIKVKSNG